MNAPHKIAEETFYLVEAHGAALASLGELLEIAPENKVTDSSIQGIGMLLGIVATSLLDCANRGVQVCQPPPVHSS